MPQFTEYNPLQPALETISYDFLEPKSNKYSNNIPVTLFYQFKISDPAFEYIPILPDGCIEIIFCLHPSNPHAKLCGTPLTSKKIRFQTGCEHFGIRLLPGFGVDKLHFSMMELIDEEIPLSKLIASSDAIVEQMMENPSFQQRVKIFDRCLQSSAINIKDLPSYMVYSIKEIFTSRGNIEIHRLAQNTGYSDQYFRKKFEEYVGITPKLFSQIVRFQSSLKSIMHHDCNLMDIVDEYGFYDQAHLIREYKRFNFMTPSQVIKSFHTG